MTSRERTIRVLHSQSFIDDPTRIFRAIRFKLRSRFRISNETLALIKEAVHKELIDRLSGRRLFSELRRLLSEREPRLTICRLAELDLLRFIHPDLTWSRRLDGVLKKVEESPELVCGALSCSQNRGLAPVRDGFYGGVASTRSRGSRETLCIH